MSPIFQTAIAGHNGRAGFVAAHDEFEEALAAALGELLHAHDVDDQEIGLEILRQDVVVASEGLVVQEDIYDVEDVALPDGVTELNGLVTEGASKVVLASVGRAHEENVAVFAEEAAGGQIEDVFFGQAGVEGPVEGLEGLELAEGSGFDATAQSAFAADMDLVLQEQFEELRVRQLIELGFVQANVKALGQAGEFEKLQGLDQGFIHVWFSKRMWIGRRECVSKASWPNAVRVWWRHWGRLFEKGIERAAYAVVVESVGGDVPQQFRARFLRPSGDIDQGGVSGGPEWRHFGGAMGTGPR